jgi:hypothetical protein
VVHQWYPDGGAEGVRAEREGGSGKGERSDRQQKLVNN